MTILETLYVKYGHDAIDNILSYLNHGDRNYRSFYQYISTSDHYRDNNVSNYKNRIIPELARVVQNKFLLYEFTNIIGEFNFEFKQFNTIITYGTFDLFHIGHLNLLNKAKSMCNTLIVGVSTDEFNALKGKQCVIPYEQRALIVSNVRAVDKVIPETSWEQKTHDISQYHADCFVIGDDWLGKFDYLKSVCTVIYLPRTDGISSTQLRNRTLVQSKNT